MNQFFPSSDCRIAQRVLGDVLDTIAEKAIFTSGTNWEKSGSIENFRIAAGESPHFRTGSSFPTRMFTSGWMRPAGFQSTTPPLRLRERFTCYPKLIRNAQDPDGYLFTYNQIHFPGTALDGPPY